MKALIRIAQRRQELTAKRRSLIRVAILSAILGALIGPTIIVCLFSAAPRVLPVPHRAWHRSAHCTQLRPSRFDRTFTIVSHAMYDSLPSWFAQHPGEWCPETVRSLLRASSPSVLTVSNVDAWGHPMEIRCRDTGAGHTIQLRSPGPDGVFDTADDIYITR